MGRGWLVTGGPISGHMPDLLIPFHMHIYFSWNMDYRQKWDDDEALNDMTK